LYAGAKTAGACKNAVLVSVSDDGGATFTGSTTDPRSLTEVTQAKGQATADQWFQWSAFTSKGTLAVSYYDRQYGTDETTGFSDVTVSGSSGRDLGRFASKRVTSASMPLPTQFTNAQGNSGFWGDYGALDVAGPSQVRPVWSDTRLPDLFSCANPGGGITLPPALCTGQEANGRQANNQVAFTATTTLP
jgi:hypothetical protein